MTDKKDLTRIEDLSEFIHQDDPDVDRALDDDEDALPSLDDLEDEDQAVLDSHVPFPKGGVDESPDEDLFQSEPEEENEDETEDDSASFFSTEETSEESEEGDYLHSDDEPFSLSEVEEESEEESEGIFGETDNFSFDTSEESLEEEVEEHSPDETADFELSEPSEPDEIPEFVEPEPVVVRPSRPHPEKFEDVKQFAQNMTYGKIVSGGNPPYSLIVKNIVYEEDAADILALLGEHGLLDASNEATFAQSLKTGALLLSHLSEYSAIFLAHKMRRYRLDIMVGLSEELHPSKSYDSKETGLVRKENLRQNKAETLHLSTTPVSLEQILITTTPTLEGHRIHKYLGMLSEHQSIDADELERLTLRSLEEDEETDSENHKEKTKEKIPLSFLEIPAEQEDELIQKYAPGLQQLYHSLAEELRGQALRLGANAIVGVNYQVTPLLETRSNQPQPKYMITCTATAVWVSGLSDLG